MPQGVKQEDARNPYAVYVGSKVILARPMDSLTFAKKHKAGVQKDLEDGYEVIYPDGYISWSPKKVFENAYRHVSKEERNLMTKGV